MGQELAAVNALAARSVRAIIILPQTARCPMHASLVRQVLPVEAELLLPYEPGLYWMGARMTSALKGHKFALAAFLIDASRVA